MSRNDAYSALVAAQRRPGRESTDGSLDLPELVRLGTLAASSHNTQPWRFRLRDRALDILPDFSRRCPVGDPDDGHLFKSLGCAAENIVQAAAAQGHAADVVFDPRSKTVHVALSRSKAVRPGELFHAIPRRQCTRTRYQGRAIAPPQMALLEAAGRGDRVRTRLIDDPGLRDAIVDQVREGDLAQLSDRAFRRELMTWLRFNDAAAIETGDGLATRPAGQPSLPDWLAKRVLRFVLTGRSQANTDAVNIRSSPLIAVVAASDDRPAAWIEAGRAYQRLALQATALGIRTAFINQPIEVRALRPRLSTLLGLVDEIPLLMLRLGFAPEAPFSLRRPVSDVILQG